MIVRMRFGLRAAVALCVLSLSSAAAPGAMPAAATAAAAAPAAAPVTFTVNSITDHPADFTGEPNFDTCRTNLANTTCTLRAALMNANRHAGGATIHLPAGTYTMTIAPASPLGDANGSFDISNTVSLVGAGAATTIVDGGGLDGVFFVHAGAAVTITGLTIQNGSNEDGAGLENAGQLNLADSVVRGNSAIFLGGGLINDAAGSATLTRDTIEANRASKSGGGLSNSGTLAINDTTIDNNIAIGQGGGLSNEGGSQLTVFDSTISNNSATAQGGGVQNFGSARFFHTTIAGNLADDSGPNGNDGGGLYNAAAAPTGTVQIWNSLLQFNYAGLLSNDCAGQPLTSKDYNFIEFSCSLTGTTHNNLGGFDLHLAPLAANGGPTLTRALLAGHPAIDKIPPGLCQDPFGTAPVPDQRGVIRPVGPLCDMGAYEGSLPTPLLGRNLVVNGDAEASAGSPSGAQVGVPVWATEGQFTVVPYNAPGGFPAVPTDTVPSNHGVNFFAGGNAALSLGQQFISLAAISPTVDAGGVHFLLSASLGGFGSQEDNALISLSFVDAHVHSLALYGLGPVTAAQRGDKTGLLPLSLAGVVPPGTRSVFVTLTLTRAPGPGSYDDGYADNLSLVLTDRLYLPLVQR